MDMNTPPQQSQSTLDDNGVYHDDVLGAMPTWDLTEFFESPDSPEITKAIEELKQDAETFQTDYKGQIATILYHDDAANLLFEALKRYEDISEKSGKLGSYCGLLYAQKSDDPKRAKLYGDMQSHLTEAGKFLLFFELELNKLDDEKLNAVCAQEPLSHYAPWLEDLRKEKPYQLDDKLEELFLDRSIPARTAWVRLFDETISSLTANIDGKDLPLEAALTLMQDRDEAKREAAAHALAKVFKDNKRLITNIFNTIMKDKAICDDWRGFKDIADSRHLANRVEGEVVDALHQAVIKAYPKISHRYYALKAKWLGKDKLNYWDRNAPLPTAPQKTYRYDEAVERVLEAYGQFSPKLVELAKPFFENRWVDVPNLPGKATGAFAHPCVPSMHPFLMLNYLGKPRDVMTLAHELGHGVHQRLAASQGALMAPTPLTLAETASVFGEMLTFRALLKETTDPAARKALLASKVEDMINTVVRQIAFYTFERRMHEERKAGELTADRLCELWLEVQSESLGEAILANEGYENYWVYIGHFIHAPFYVYAYAFGDCLVNSLYALYQKGHEGFEEKYFALLKAGGSRPYNELLAPFGLDLKDPNFWNIGLNTISAMIDELESLS